MRRQRRRKRARFEEGPDFRAQSARKPAGPTVYSCPARGRKGFFDTLRTVLFKHCPFWLYRYFIVQRSGTPSTVAVSRPCAGSATGTPGSSPRWGNTASPDRRRGPDRRPHRPFPCAPSANPPCRSAFPPSRWSFPDRCRWRGTTAPPPGLLRRPAHSCGHIPARR